jgi:hypothetical protein
MNYKTGDVVVKASGNDALVEVFIIDTTFTTQDSEGYMTTCIRYHKDDNWFSKEPQLKYNSSFLNQYIKKLQDYTHFIIHHTFKLEYIS